MKKQYFLFSVLILIAATATVSLGQTPKNDRLFRANPASEKTELREPRETRLFPKRINMLRAAQYSVLLPDSIITEMNPVFFEDGDEDEKMKTAYQYSNSGKLILETEYVWNEDTQTWEESDVHGYDERGNLILEINSYTSYFWEEDKWRDIDIWEKIEHAYDVHGNEILHVFYEYDTEEQEFVPIGKYEAEYDQLNWQTLSTYYQWIDEQWVDGFEYNYWASSNCDTSSPWSGKTVTTYTDNADSYIVTETHYNFHEGKWMIESQRENAYTGKRQLRESEVEYNSTEINRFPTLIQPRTVNKDLLSEAYLNYPDGSIGYSSKTEYMKINTDGTPAEIIFSEWDSSANAWKETNRTKKEYDYNTRGLITAFRGHYSADGGTNWVLSDHESYTVSYTFDSSNNPLSYIFTQTDVDMYKYEYTYDAQNRPVTAIAYGIYGGSGISSKDEEFERAFDSYGNLILIVEKSYDQDALNTFCKYEYAYNAAGKQTMNSYIAYDYDENNGYGLKYEYDYDANGNQTLYGFFEYNGATQAFVQKEKTEYQYDADGNEILYVDYSYDDATKALVPRYKSEYTYGDVLIDFFDTTTYNPLTAKDYTWENNDWVLEWDGRYDWTFDADNNPLTVNMYIKENEEEIWCASITWYYSMHDISNLSNVNNNELYVWVSDDELQIKGASNENNIQIFDIHGRQTANFKRTSNSINISNLPKGVYILKLDSVKQKFVKQ